MPSFNGTVVSFDLERDRKCGKGLWKDFEKGTGRSAERRNDGILLKLVYKLKLTTKAYRNLYTSEQ